MLWSTCVLAERRGAAADGFWKTEDVCVCHFWLFYYCARSGLCVRKHTEERRNAEEEEGACWVCVVCAKRCAREDVCVNAAETMARRVDARGQGIAGH